MNERIQRLADEIGRLVQANRSLLEAAEGRSMTAEERQEYDRRDTRIDELTEEKRRLERQLEREGQLENRSTDPTDPADPADPSDPENRGGGSGGSGDDPTEPFEFRGEMIEPHAFEDAEYRALFARYLQMGSAGALGELEERALSAGSDPDGGYTIAPRQFVARLLQAVDDRVFVRQFGTIETISQGTSLGVPSLDADPADADWTAEVAQVTEDTSMEFGDRELEPHPLSKLAKVSRKLLRASALNVESIVRMRLAYKFAVTMEKAYMTGDGANKPLGLFTASPSGISTGRDVLSGVSNDIDGDSLIDAKHELKAAYWANARWIASREFIKRARKLKTTDDQYIWQPGLQAGVPDRILDLPFEISEFAPSVFTSGSYVAVLGDLEFYWIADALDFEIQVLAELYAETNQTGYIGRAESDGAPVLEEAFVRIITT